MCIFSSPIPFMEINSVEILAIHIAVKISLLSESIKGAKLILESDSAKAVLWGNRTMEAHGIRTFTLISSGMLA